MLSVTIDSEIERRLEALGAKTEISKAATGSLPTPIPTDLVVS